MAAMANTRLIDFGAYLFPLKKAKAVKTQLRTVKSEPRDLFF